MSNCNCAPLGAVNNPPEQITDLDTLLRRVAQRDAATFAQFYDATKARVASTRYDRAWRIRGG